MQLEFDFYDDYKAEYRRCEVRYEFLRASESFARVFWLDRMCVLDLTVREVYGRSMYD